MAPVSVVVVAATAVAGVWIAGGIISNRPMTDADHQADRLAAESLAVQDPTGWFECLYAEAEDGAAVVPWDRGAPHPLLVEWA